MIWLKLCALAPLAGTRKALAAGKMAILTVEGPPGSTIKIHDNRDTEQPPPGSLAQNAYFIRAPTPKPSYLVNVSSSLVSGIGSIALLL